MNVCEIENPDFIKKLNYEELKDLSEDIRSFLLNSLSKTGGHLGSNLGVVELTLALYKNYDFPSEQLIFDVGHQSYVHKIITGRAKEFPTLRKYQGLSGFIKRSESIYDVWEAGHSSTSLSAAAGFAKINQIEKNNKEVVAIIGDGSLTNGMALEAMNHIVEENLNVTIIINDNEMSISKNIGFINDVLNSLKTKNEYYKTKNVVRGLSEKSTVSKKVYQIISSIKNTFKTELHAANTFFTTMGYYYLGPVDGHDIFEMTKHIAMLKDFNGPKILHVKTIKGKGYEFAEKDQWHAITPFNLETGKALKTNNSITYSQVVALEMDRIMNKDPKVLVVTPAMIDGSALNDLKNKYSNRVLDVGIAEEHAATISASLSMGGYKPFLTIYSTFLQRAYDQLFHDIDRQKANVLIGIDRAGLVGADGETHQGIYDISFLSHMPNSIITQGKDALETRSLLNLLFQITGPKYLRYPRGGSFSHDDLKADLIDIKFGKWDYLIQHNSNVVVITYGEFVGRVSEIIEKNALKVDLINALFIKPLDYELLNKISGKKIYVVEEHTAIGGLYTLMVQYYSDNNLNVKVIGKNLGNNYIEQGEIEELYQENKLNSENILSDLEELL